MAFLSTLAAPPQEGPPGNADLWPRNPSGLAQPGLMAARVRLPRRRGAGKPSRSRVDRSGGRRWFPTGNAVRDPGHAPCRATGGLGPSFQGRARARRDASEWQPTAGLATTGRPEPNTKTPTLAWTATTPGLGTFVFETDTGRLWWDVVGHGGEACGPVAILRGGVILGARDIVVV